MLNLNFVMVGTMQPKVLADFYEKVFERKPDMSEAGWTGWMVGSAFFSVGEHSQMVGMTKDPGRVIFNFATEDVKGEFDRIVKLGATVIKAPYQMEEMGDSWIATLADPDGNFFQLVSPWKAK